MQQVKHRKCLTKPLAEYRKIIIQFFFRSRFVRRSAAVRLRFGFVCFIPAFKSDLMDCSQTSSRYCGEDLHTLGSRHFDKENDTSTTTISLTYALLTLSDRLDIWLFSTIARMAFAHHMVRGCNRGSSAQDGTRVQPPVLND